MAIVIDGQNLTVDEVIRVARKGEQVEISQGAREAVKKARDYVDKKLEEGAVIYGLTTGFEMCIRDRGGPALVRTFAVLAAAEFCASIVSGAYARRQLGGMSGDIAGFALVWSELAAVLSLAVI